MPGSWSSIRDALLFEEHLLLGALYTQDEPLLAAPRRYADGRGEREAFVEGCALCDLSGMSLVLVSGEGADAFVRAACAARPLAVGECAFGAVVTGDGSVASIPLVTRTGDVEYLLFDPTPRGDMLIAWLRFLCDIEQDGYRPYEGVSVEDVTGSLHPLLLWGPQATAVIGDYVADLALLPVPGTVRDVRLDRIESLVVSPSVDGSPCYLLLVPPAAARVIWRSLLSFAIVAPVGTHALVEHVTSVLPWGHAAIRPDRLQVSASVLQGWGVARPGTDFVGARALAQ